MAGKVQLNYLHKPELGARASGPQAAIALGMVKNEGDIIGAWMSHACALFDAVFLVDHSSTDGTREFLLDLARSRGNIHLFEFEEQGFFQEEIKNQLAEIASAHYADGWMFPLDADEFLVASSRDELLTRLRAAPSDRPLNVQWRNVAPLSLLLDEQFTLRSPCLVAPFRGAFGKIVMHSSHFLERGFRFTQGNHGVRDSSGTYIDGDAALDFGEIYHVPIRSLDHFVLKCVQGCLAYDSLPPDRKEPWQGTHWRDMVALVLQDGGLDASAVRQFIAHYGQRPPAGETLAQLGIYELIADGWICASLDVAHGGPLVAARRQTFADLLAQVLAAQAEPQLAAFSQVAASSAAIQRNGHLRELEQRALAGKPGRPPNLQ